LKKTVFILILALFASLGWAQDPPQMRAVYVPTFSTNSQAKCDQIIANVLASNLNAVFVQVRSRGDAYYYPNREDSTYPNPEPRGQLWTISPSDLDILQYYIDRLHNASPRREVHAWLTTYNSWGSSTAPSSPAHVYNATPAWRTENSAGTTYDYNNDGPLDPGIPAVQDYLYNIFMDIVRNYDIDGIHFDYIRLLSSNSGYDPVALAQFQAETGFSYSPASPGALSEVFEAWRRDQISQLVHRVHSQTMLEKPWVDTSAFLVNFSDSVEVLGQGYNWWAAHEAIDMLHPGCYASSVSSTVGDWNDYIAKLAQNGDENALPMAAAIGSYLFVDSSGSSGGVYDPPRNLQSVNTLETNARKPDGYNFFAYNALFVSGTSPDPNDVLAQALFNSGGPMDGWAPVPAIPHKTDEETTAPNAPASLSATLSGGIPTVSFNRPAAAGDGDLPVHYRLYRDTDSSVDLYYDNMVMEWWDLDSSRTSFSFDDSEAPVGTWYYAAVAYDDWNNQASSVAGPVTVTGGEYIIETIAGMLHASDYSEPAGSFSGSSSHSTAPGCTSPAPNPASRFATPGTDGSSRNDRARFTPLALATGTYNVYVTTYGFSSANAQGITCRIVDADGTSTTTLNLTSGTAGNSWLQVGTMNFTSGSGHYVEFDNATQTNFGDSTNSRMAACAVRLVQSGAASEAKEPKPAVGESLSSIIEVIVDSEPTSLDYDDADSSSEWQSSSYSPSGTLYGGSCRYYAAANYPMDSYAVWVVDLPQEGYWEIEGWIRGEQGSLAQGAQYRFVDGLGVAHSVTTTQQTGSSGWTINVDGVDAQNAYFFNKGRVYVVLYGNSTGSELLMADALRFTLNPSKVAHWSSY